MNKTICDGCGREFKGMDEYVSPQSVHIKLTLVSGRRGHQTPEYFDFDDFNCVIKWSKQMVNQYPELVWKDS